MNLDSPINVDDIGPYLIHSHREIIALMRRLSDRRELVRMIFSQGEEALATTVLMASEYGVIVSAAFDPDLTARIIGCNNISFDTALDQVRIAFFAPRVKACTYESEPALHMELPDSVIRLQRREFYRVMTSRCTVQIDNRDGTGPHPVSFGVQNVSAGGVALIDAGNALDRTAGREYRRCELILQGGQAVMVNLQVMNHNTVTLADGRAAHRVGCAFLDLAAAQMALIQRSVTQSERELAQAGMR